MKRLLTMILVLLCLICGAQACRAEPALTLMVYLCGSDLETEAGAASADLAEMMAHYPETGDLRVLVMPSGSKAWQSDVATEETVIYELTGEGLMQCSSLPVQNMGDPSALTALLDYGYTHAPAQRYALLLWNHGAGPHIGLCFDERFATEDGMDGLTLSELSAALADSPAAQTKLDWIGFDACLMASLETACAVAPYADYMIASQETEPASGWSYAFLEHAAKDASGAETGQRVIDAYFDSLTDSLASLALSCVDLRDMSVIRGEMDRLFNGLHLQLNEASYPTFADCRVNSKSLGSASSYEYDLIDLVDLLQVYEAEGVAACGDLLARLEEVIVASRSNTPYVNGLSVYYPHYGTQEEAETVAPEGYAAFIADMSAIRLGEPLTDWSQTDHPEAAISGGVTQVTMALTPEQADTLDTAVLFIFKQMSANDYQLVYRTQDVTLTEDHVLSAAYEDQALFIVDAQGKAASDALPYFLQGDAVVLSGRLMREMPDDPEDDSWYAFVNCYFRQDEEGKYRLAEVREHTSSPTQQGKTTLRLEDYDTLSIYQGSFVPAYAQDGSLLPPAQWAEGGLIYGWWFNLTDVPGWSIDFLSQQDGRSRYALLQMTDTQNQVACSELLSIPNPHITEIPLEAQTLVDHEICRIRLTGAQEIGGMHPALRLNFTCENRDSRPISVDVRMLQMDDVIVDCNAASASAVAPGKTGAFEVEIDRETLEKCGVQSVCMLRMNLAVNSNYTEELFEQPVVCTLPVDLSGMAPEPVQYDVLDTVKWDGLEFTLLELGVEDEYVTGRMRIRNLTQEAQTLDTGYLYLNDLQVLGYLTDRISAMTIPAGVRWDTGFKANMRSYPNDLRRPENSRFLPETLGMTQLHTLGLNVYHDDWRDQAQVTFTLQAPLPLPVEESNARISAWPVIYDKEGVTIRIADYTWEPESPYQTTSRYINLFAENQTGVPVKINIPWREQENCYDAQVNGRLLQYILGPEIPAEMAVMEDIWYSADDAQEELKSLELLLHITDEAGRNDQIRLRIEAQSASRAEGSYRILEAEQMMVTVEPTN